jgi:hypothetical protein
MIEARRPFTVLSPLPYESLDSGMQRDFADDWAIGFMFSQLFRHFNSL